MKKQIMEIKDCIDNAYGVDCAYFGVDGFAIASSLYKAGYRKQKEGEWIGSGQTDEYICSLCGGIAPVDCEKEDFYKSNFCPNCGAKMKGGAE